TCRLLSRRTNAVADSSSPVVVSPLKILCPIQTVLSHLSPKARCHFDNYSLRFVRVWRERRSCLGEKSGGKFSPAELMMDILLQRASVVSRTPLPKNVGVPQKPRTESAELLRGFFMRHALLALARQAPGFADYRDYSGETAFPPQAREQFRCVRHNV